MFNSSFTGGLGGGGMVWVSTGSLLCSAMPLEYVVPSLVSLDVVL